MIRQRWLSVAGIFVASLLSSVIYIADPADIRSRLQLMVSDLYFQVPVTMQDTTVKPLLLAIDEDSLDRLGQWPWPRSLIGETLITLYEAGARVVGLDILLAERDRLSPSAVVERFPVLEDKLAELPNAYGYTDYDRFLADVFAQTPTVLAISSDQGGVMEGGRRLALAYLGVPTDYPLPESAGVIAPYQGLMTSESPLVAHINISADVDGLIRRMPLLGDFNGEVVPAFSLAMLANLTGHQTLVMASADRSDRLTHVRIGGTEIRVDEQGFFRVDPRLSHPEVVSFAEYVENPERFSVANRPVVIGPTAIGLMDLHDMPGRLNVPGPVIHTQALHQMLSDQYFRDDELTRSVSVAIAFVLTLVIAIAVLMGSQIVTLITASALFTCTFAACFWLFSAENWLVDWGWPAVHLALVTGFGLAPRIVSEDGERRRVKAAFSSYVNPALLDRIAEHTDALKLGGETREITVMFADIRGFTGLSEQFKESPEQLTALLNRFLTPLSDEILDSGGTIDKYLGDAIMAFWNAPLHIEEHPKQAVEVAKNLQRILDQVSEACIQEGLIQKRLALAIGMNTTEALVGNLGTARRFDYSCLGDGVNLAARFEGVSKRYELPLVFGESTRRHLGDAFGITAINDLVVYGQSRHESVYTLSEYAAGWKTSHERLRQHVNSSAWDAAKQELEVLKGIPNYPQRLLEDMEKRVEERLSGGSVLDSK